MGKKERKGLFLYRAWLSLHRGSPFNWLRKGHGSHVVLLTSRFPRTPGRRPGFTRKLRRPFRITPDSVYVRKAGNDIPSRFIDKRRRCYRCVGLFLCYAIAFFVVYINKNYFWHRIFTFTVSETINIVLFTVFSCFKGFADVFTPFAVANFVSLIEIVNTAVGRLNTLKDNCQGIFRYF